MGIEEILEKEDKIFVDNSVIALPEKRDHKLSRKGFYYNSIDFHLLTEAIPAIRELLNKVFTNQKTIVIPEVISEMQDLETFVDVAIEYRQKSIAFKKNKQEFSSIDYNLGVLKSLVRDIITVANSSRLDRNDDFKKIYSICSLVARQRMIKDPGDFSFPVYKDTDEKLVANAFYSSIIEGKRAGILTNDSDIERIMTYTYRMITSPDMLDYKQKVLDKLEQSPVSVYIVPRNGDKRVLSTEQFSPSRIPSFPVLNRREIYQIACGVRKTLSSLSVFDESKQSQQNLHQAV